MPDENSNWGLAAGNYRRIGLLRDSTLSTGGGTVTGNLHIGGNLSVTGTTALDGSTATTPATADNSTAVATTAFVKAQGYGTGSVTSITAGSGLTGGTITTTGTFALDTAYVSANWLPLAGGSLSGPVTLIGAAPQISLNNATANRIVWTGSGVGAPTLTTSSVGTKLTLYPNESATTVDFALGIQAGGLWYAVPDNAGSSHIWYGATTQMMTLAAGNLTINGATATKPGSTSWVNPSSRDLKEDIQSYRQGLAAVLALHPVTYRYNGKGGLPTDERFVGLLHDETSHMPEMHKTVALANDSKVQGLDAGPLIFALVNAIKELAARLKTLEAKA